MLGHIVTKDPLVLMKDNIREINSIADQTLDFLLRPDLDQEISRGVLTIARALNILFQISATKEILF